MVGLRGDVSGTEPRTNDWALGRLSAHTSYMCTNHPWLAQHNAWLKRVAYQGAREASHHSHRSLCSLFPSCRNPRHKKQHPCQMPLAGARPNPFFSRRDRDAFCAADSFELKGIRRGVHEYRREVNSAGWGCVPPSIPVVLNGLDMEVWPSCKQYVLKSV